MTSINLFYIGKSGSIFARKYFQDVCKLSGHKCIPIAHNNYSKLKDNCCAILYHFPKKLIISDEKEYSIIQLRDPRDILVSSYFSMAYTHPYGPNTKKIQANTQKNGIEGFIKNNYKNTLDAHNMIINNSKDSNNIIYVKYSEMIFNFKNYVDKISEPFNLNEAQKLQLYNMYKKDFENITEIPEQTLKAHCNEVKNGEINKFHKRKMLPGDYKEKLMPQTIEFLTEKFADVLKFINSV